MIGKNFIYCKPESEQEAVDLYTKFSGEGKNVLYYGGGSEIITMCTSSSIAPDAVIDIKRIPSLHVLNEEDGLITIGASCTLEDIRVSSIFALLGETVGRIADHTNQCRITLGGNISGSIIYKESVLPLLLTDANITLFGPTGKRSECIHEVFKKRIQLLNGEFINAVRLESKYAHMPYTHIKRAFSEKIGYPAVTIAAILVDGIIRAAYSGICSYPFRSIEMEQALNNKAFSIEERVKEAVSLLPEPPQTDCEGSAEYRKEIMQIALRQVVSYFEDIDNGGKTQ